jgi:hypothetical protein
VSKISPRKTKSNEDAEATIQVPTPDQAEKFFQAVIDRRISDAEKELDSVRTSIPASEAASGYLKALEGLLLTAKSNDDKYLYLSKIEKTPKKLKAIRKEFTNHSTNVLHADYDKGYFQALESFMRKLERSEIPAEPSNDETKTKN